MKRLLALATLMVIPGGASANLTLSGTDTPKLPVEPEMQAFVNQLLEMTGLQNEVRVVIDPDAKGCGYATTIGGKQYIGVDLKCSGPLRTEAGYNYHAAGLLAHEVGHLLGGHTTNRDGGPGEESDADEWAGWILYRLDASLDEAQTFYRSTSPNGSKSHPPRATRLASVERGWSRARADLTRLAPQAPKIPKRRDHHVPNPSPQPRPVSAGWAELMQTAVPWRR